MAKRRRSTTTIVRTAPAFGGFRAAAPIIKVSAPRAPAVHKKKHRRKGGGGGESSSLTSKENMALATGAVVLGFIDRQGMKIPTVPMLGRAGSIAVGGMLIGKHMKLPIATKVGKAALVIALYELGKSGKIEGVSGGMQTV